LAVLAWSTTQVGGAMILRTSCEVLVFRFEVAILDCAGTRTPNRTFRASQSAQIRISRPGRTSLF